MTVKHFQPEFFNQRLHAEVIKSRLTFTEISRRTGISRTNLYGYVYNGVTPNITTFVKLCTCLGVSADYLLFGKEV